MVWNCSACGDGTDQAAEFERTQLVLEKYGLWPIGLRCAASGPPPQVPQFHIGPLTLDETLAVRERNRLRAAVHIELVEHTLDVGADCGGADVQVARNVALVLPERE